MERRAMAARWRSGRVAATTALVAATMAVAAAQNTTYLGFFDKFHAAFTSVDTFRGTTALYVTSFGIRDRTETALACARAMSRPVPTTPHAFPPSLVVSLQRPSSWCRTSASCWTTSRPSSPRCSPTASSGPTRSGTLYALCATPRPAAGSLAHRARTRARPGTRNTGPQLACWHL